MSVRNKSILLGIAISAAGYLVYSKLFKSPSSQEQVEQEA